MTIFKIQMRGDVKLTCFNEEKKGEKVSRSFTVTICTNNGLIYQI